jgi:AhpD family alkylhydroperoxidase
LAQAALMADALDTKTKKLIPLAIPVATRCDDRIAFHAEAAMKQAPRVQRCSRRWHGGLQSGRAARDVRGAGARGVRSVQREVGATRGVGNP